MSEEEKQEVQSVPGNDTENGDKPQTDNIIEQADAAAKRLQAENERLERNISQLREIEVRKTFGGQTDGNATTEKREETPKEYTERIKREHGIIG